MTSSNDRSDVGRGALRDALQGEIAPTELHDRVRQSLESRGLVRRPSRTGMVWIGRLGLLAAGVLIGVMLRSTQPTTRERRDTATSSIPQYVLLLYGNTQGDTGSVHVAREREYGQWASALGPGARWIGGNELHDVVSAVGSNGSSALGADRLAGYFVIEASSPERAAEVAQTCPHVKYGGRVVVMSVAS